MAVIRVGVQAGAGSAGQRIDFDEGDIATSLSLTNRSGESVEYTTGGAWTTVAAGGSASVRNTSSDAFRLRKLAAGAYPAPVDVDVTAAESKSLNVSEVSAARALVSGTAKVGTLAAPLGTITGSTGALFSASGLPYQFPANTLAVGDMIQVFALVRKRTATATATARLLFGSSNSASDSAVVDISMTNADKQDACLMTYIHIVSATGILANPNVAQNSQGTDRFREFVIDTTAINYLNASVGSASASDSFDLLAYKIWIHKAPA